MSGCARFTDEDLPFFLDDLHIWQQFITSGAFDSLIEEAARLSVTSGESLKQILEFVNMVNDQVQSIATASEQQSAASEEINHSVEQVATISSETARAMEQASRAAVADIAQQSQALQRLIGQMKKG